MYRDELKVMEILLNYAIYKNGLKESIEHEFSSIEEYSKAKINIFNLISIYTISSHESELLNIDCEEFINKGITKEKKEPINGLDLDLKTKMSAKEILKTIIDCLKNRDFTFDRNNNIIINTDKAYITMTSEWLYYLSKICQESSFRKIFLFNKNKENDIIDEKSLLNYLYHTKTFLVTISSEKPINLKETYQAIEKSTKEKLASVSNATSAKIKETFNSVAKKNANAKIEKYTIPSYNYLIKKANDLEHGFYNLPLAKQKELLSKWLLEMEMTNNRIYEDFRVFTLYATPAKSHFKLSSSVNIENSVLGLLATYFNILLDSKVNLFEISLSNLKIKKYISPKTKKIYEELRQIIKKINRQKEQAKKQGSTSFNIQQRINKINFLRDDSADKEINEEIKKLEKDFVTFKEEQKEESALAQQRNTLQSILHYNQEHSLEEIAFDNQYITELIKEATIKGRLYFNDYKPDHIIIELFDSQLGLVTFRVEITVDELMNLIENINYSLSTNNINLVNKA